MPPIDPSRVLVFNHLPKAAGNSVRESLRSSLRPASFIYYLDRALLGGYDDLDALGETMRNRFVADPAELPDAEFVSGHISPGTTRVRYPQARHVTILRNPQTRMISQWVHSRSLTDLDLRHWGPGYPFRVARWPLGRYLDHAMIAPNVDNTITRFLTWPHEALAPTSFIETSRDEELFEKAVATLDAMTHVNVIENPAFMTELGDDLGLSLVGGRLNDRSTYPPVVPTDLGTELDQATRELLDHRTRIDRRIWEHVAATRIPGADLQAILDKDLAGQVERYNSLPAAGPRGGPVRRAAERAYALKARLDPRLRDFR